MNKEANKLQCEIVEDLLPLYHDGVVNSITHQAVKNHIDECEKCKKEYESLSVNIGSKAESSTKEAFTIMIKKKRIRQFFLTVLACVLSCAILSGVWSFLNHACVFVQKDVTVERVYRYSSADGEEMFYVDYECPPARSVSQEFKDEDGIKICKVTLRAPFILPSREEYNYNDVMVLTAESNIDNTAPADKLIFGGLTVWTKEENSDDEIPAYVYAYDVYENGNQDEFGDSDTCSWWADKNTVTLQHTKYGMLTWNLDGELIDGSPEMEKEILDLYK